MKAGDIDAAIMVAAEVAARLVEAVRDEERDWRERAVASIAVLSIAADIAILRIGHEEVEGDSN